MNMNEHYQLTKEFPPTLLPNMESDPTTPVAVSLRDVARLHRRRGPVPPRPRSAVAAVAAPGAAAELPGGHVGGRGDLRLGSRRRERRKGGAARRRDSGAAEWLIGFHLVEVETVSLRRGDPYP